MPELDRVKLAGRIAYSLRGFGEFEERWGIGENGKELTDCLRRTSPYDIEEILSSGVRRILPNRLAYEISTLKMGTSCREKEAIKPPICPTLALPIQKK